MGSRVRERGVRRGGIERGDRNVARRRGVDEAKHRCWARSFRGWHAVDARQMSRRTPLVISEIMYNPRGSQANEFIEIFNTHHLTQDLSGFSLKDDLDVSYTFTNGTTIAPGGFLLLTPAM